MKKKILLKIFMLFLCISNFIGCDKNNELEDKQEIVKMYISHETSTYIPLGSSKPIECLLVKEEGEREYSRLPFEGITGFIYEYGHEYIIKVEKSINIHTHANAVRTKYRLIEILEDKTINTSPQWDILIDESNDYEIDISSRYLGIQGWWCNANPPRIYVGAVFPKNTFATSFDKEIMEKKKNINLYFNFQDPYITYLDDARLNKYLKKMNDAISSKEYEKHRFPKRPYIAKLAELKNLNDLWYCIDDNDDFAKTLIEIGKQDLDLKDIESLCVGKVVHKNFTVSMDTPENGLFIETPSNLNELVFVRSLTYGTSAYFLIASRFNYQEVLSALKGPYLEEKQREEVLKESQIILLTVTDIRQTANISKSFNELQNYLNNPFTNEPTYAYGYPIFCQGQYAKDNSLYIKH